MKKKEFEHTGNTKVEKSKGELKWHSFDEVFKKSRQSEEFQTAYSEEMLRLKLALQIRDVRTKKRLTQKVVAERARMPQSVIARIESGDRGLTIDTLGRVAHALGKRIQLV